MKTLLLIAVAGLLVHSAWAAEPRPKPKPHPLRVAVNMGDDDPYERGKKWPWPCRSMSSPTVPGMLSLQFMYQATEDRPRYDVKVSIKKPNSEEWLVKDDHIGSGSEEPVKGFRERTINVFYKLPPGEYHVGVDIHDPTRRVVRDGIDRGPRLIVGFGTTLTAAPELPDESK